MIIIFYFNKIYKLEEELNSLKVLHSEKMLGKRNQFILKKENNYYKIF
jgi:hypothetical protein